MVRKAEDDWKDFLSPDAKTTLAEILNSTRKHKGAYMQSDDVKVAQLWSAIIEMNKKLEEMQKIQIKLEEPFKAIVEVGDKEKRRAIADIVRGIVRPTNEGTEEATQDLVESLMRF